MLTLFVVSETIMEFENVFSANRACSFRSFTCCSLCSNRSQLATSDYAFHIPYEKYEVKLRNIHSNVRHTGTLKRHKTKNKNAQQLKRHTQQPQSLCFLFLCRQSGRTVFVYLCPGANFLTTNPCMGPNTTCISGMFK